MNRLLILLCTLLCSVGCRTDDEPCQSESGCGELDAARAVDVGTADAGSDVRDFERSDFGQDADTEPTAWDLVVGVQIMPLQFDLMHAESQQLTAVAVDAEGSPVEDAPIRWSTSGDVITVNQGGIAFAKNFSSDVVIASVGDVRGLSEGRVRDANGEYFTLNLVSWTALPGQSLQLAPAIVGPDGELVDETPTVSYAVSDESLLVIDDTGFLYASSAGYAVVFAEHSSGRKASMPVWVE